MKYTNLVDAVMGLNESTGYSDGHKFTTVHSGPAFKRICDEQGFKIERDPNGIGQRNYLAFKGNELAGKYSDGQGHFYNEMLDLQKSDIHVDGQDAAPMEPPVTEDQDDQDPMEKLTNLLRRAYKALPKTSANQALMFDITSALSVMGESVQESEQLEERSGYSSGRSWALLPATMALYNRRTVDIITAASTWMPGRETIYVCSKMENGRKRLLFAASAGEPFYKVGETYSVYHDQTQAYKGEYTIENVVVIENNEIVSKVNDIGLKEKCSVAVFK